MLGGCQPCARLSPLTRYWKACHQCTCVQLASGRSLLPWPDARSAWSFTADRMPRRDSMPCACLGRGGGAGATASPGGVPAMQVAPSPPTTPAARVWCRHHGGGGGGEGDARSPAPRRPICCPICRGCVCVVRKLRRGGRGVCLHTHTHPPLCLTPAERDRLKPPPPP